MFLSYFYYPTISEGWIKYFEIFEFYFDECTFYMITWRCSNRWSLKDYSAFFSLLIWLWNWCSEWKSSTDSSPITIICCSFFTTFSEPKTIYFWLFINTSYFYNRFFYSSNSSVNEYASAFSSTSNNLSIFPYNIANLLTIWLTPSSRCLL